MKPKVINLFTKLLIAITSISNISGMHQPLEVTQQSAADSEFVEFIATITPHREASPEDREFQNFIANLQTQETPRNLPINRQEVIVGNNRNKKIYGLILASLIVVVLIKKISNSKKDSTKKMLQQKT